uniref:Uncharacterized protein n=1 Tax=Chlamydomonas leiostraca TaxID=1034604 RepID=A0A7S0RV30_9CHLO
MAAALAAGASGLADVPGPLALRELWQLRAAAAARAGNRATAGSDDAGAPGGSTATGGITRGTTSNGGAGAGAGSGGSGGISASGSCGSGSVCIDFLDPVVNSLLAHAALIMAYMYFDGEGGLRLDKGQACCLFKLASVAGSREAARVLAWIFSTGQY